MILVMREIWLRSIRDAVLAVFFIATAALGFWAAGIPGQPEVSIMGRYGGIGCVLVAAICVVRSLNLPSAAAEATASEERKKAEAVRCKDTPDSLQK